MLLFLLIALFAVAVQSQDTTLALTIITWNTEYYFPKLGDFNALIKANGQTIKSTCESDMVVFLLQEVGAGYLDATCGDRSHLDAAASPGSSDPKQVFKNVRQGMYEFLRTNCQSELLERDIGIDYDVSCEDMHGSIGTKSEVGNVYNRVNSQIAVVFNKRTRRKDDTKRTPKYDVEIHKKNLPGEKKLKTGYGKVLTEKGGIIVEIKSRVDGTPKAAVIGVHLDSSEEKVRNLQICRIMKDLLKTAGKAADFKFKCKNEHSNPKIMYDLGTMITVLYPLGVYWTGDSNYRLPLSTFGLILPDCPIDDGADCTCKKKKRKNCVPGKAKIITQLAKLGCGDPDALLAYENGDQKSLSKSTLTLMGATVNQPYPQFPPSYPFVAMQPHELKDEDLQSNEKARALVTLWQGGTNVGEGCYSDNGKYTILEDAIEKAVAFTEKDALKVKGKAKENTEALNFGYLDRLFILNNNEVTNIERDLEVQAMLYGGDHLPQLFHVIATSGPNHMIDGEDGGDRSAININNKITLKSATIQLFTTTPELKSELKNGHQTIGEPGEEYSPHVHFGASDSTDGPQVGEPERIISGGTTVYEGDENEVSNLRSNGKGGRKIEPIKEMQRSDSTYSTDSTDSTRGPSLITRSSNVNEEDFEDLPPLSQDEE